MAEDEYAVATVRSSTHPRVVDRWTLSRGRTCIASTFQETTNGLDPWSDWADARAKLASKFNGHVELVERTETPNTFYPLIDRPSPVTDLQQLTHWGPYVTSATMLGALRRRLRDLFVTIEPAPKQEGVFGHAVRELLIAACTNAEASWRRVLRANGYGAARSPDSHLTTKDYVKLASPMRLGDWSLMLAAFPNVGEVAPFAGWSAAQSTVSLPWYEAYNRAKHDPVRNLKDATLGHLISAVAACWILHRAQFGLGAEGEETEALEVRFAVIGQPEWTLEEVYFGHLHAHTKWTPVPATIT